MKTIQVLLILMMIAGASWAQSVNKNTDFAFDLYHQLATEHKDNNLFYSPMSISTAMGMTYLGARGDTRDQMARVLYFSKDNKAFIDTFSALSNNYQIADENLTLTLANKVWAQKGYRFKKDYLSQVEETFASDISWLNFKKERGREQAVSKINKWVDKQTHHKIPQIVSSDDVNKYTRLVLTNAIYFLADWQHQFDKNNTRKGDFYAHKGKKQMADFMYQQRSFSYGENENLQVLSMPYVGGDLEMTILLPKENYGLEKLENDLSSDYLKNLLKNQQREKVRVFVPKFKIESSYQLVNSFKQMGLIDPFTKKANFSGMSKKNDLKIHKIIHKGFIQVDEKGTEAAAATAVVVIKKTSVEMAKLFRADRPFIYLIRNNKTGDVIFMGRLLNLP